MTLPAKYPSKHSIQYSIEKIDSAKKKKISVKPVPLTHLQDRAGRDSAPPNVVSTRDPSPHRHGACINPSSHGSGTPLTTQPLGPARHASATFWILSPQDRAAGGGFMTLPQPAHPNNPPQRHRLVIDPCVHGSTLLNRRSNSPKTAPPPALLAPRARVTVFFGRNWGSPGKNPAARSRRYFLSPSGRTLPGTPRCALSKINVLSSCISTV